ncbi:TetR/AcrR family transcriptional regulator [Roseovarius sp. SCSIO 43702]|uniref:TetR/AcrR family transcriptional regulator n=1 Tax=Roseovarius sp. SCSIO 43702 TaxID=2823043 RepID=UPI001C730738|nr:TetR/AcrR family transcriptional regulator [Roseovarius sp. SCSIO 43702]QYX56894.1 TetR/AcrR family transcriptional regulator [Roseovarius sp. SCSIO 43702]
MARPREFDPSKALNDIQKAFWMNGYHGTSMHDLEDATGLRKQSLYREFGNKDAMYERAMDLYINRDVADLAGALEGPGDASSRFRHFFDRVLEAPRAGDRSGCFLCNSAIDRAHEDEATAETAREGIAGTVSLFEDVLAASPPYDSDAAARHFTALTIASGYLGLRVMIRAGVPIDTLDEVADYLVASV